MVTGLIYFQNLDFCFNYFYISPSNPPRVGFLLSIKTQKIGISIKISDSLLTNNIGNAIFISSTNKKAHRSSPGPMCFYSTSENIMNQRIEKYKFSQAFRDGSKAFIAFWIITFIVFAFLKGCADEQYANELKAKQNMYVRVQVEGAN